MTTVRDVRRAPKAGPSVTLPALYLRQMADQIRNMGADPSAWLRGAGLTDDGLEEAGLASSPTIGFAVFRDLVLGALDITHEPAFGLLMGQRLLASSHGMLGYAAMNSASIRQAIELFERYIPLRISLIAIRHEIVKGSRGDAGSVRVVFGETHPLGDVRRPLLETVVLASKNILDAVSLGACRVQSAAFTFPKPTYAKLAEELFRCPVQYGASFTGFTLPLDLLDAPLKMADPAAFEDAARLCERDLDKLTRSASLAARVRQTLLEKQNGFPSLTVVARLFHMTPRTLHRRLVDEGTSFKAILEEVRELLATEHLKSGLAVQEVAYSLGYTDVANFRRAFKRWTSIPPSLYQEERSPPKTRAKTPKKKTGAKKPSSRR